MAKNIFKLYTARCHRILNRAVWSSLEASHILLGLLVSTFAISGALILGLDDTIERRHGAKIKAKGIYRDPVRSSHSHFVYKSQWLALAEPNVVGADNESGHCLF